MNKTRSRSGFTVIELLIAVGIITVVAAIILFATTRSRAKAADARTMQTLVEVRTVAVQEKFEASGGFADICSTGKVKDMVEDLAGQLQSIDYTCVSTSDEFVVAFPLQAKEGYWCVDSLGLSQYIEELPSASPPYGCDVAGLVNGGGGTPTGEEGGGGGSEQGGSGGGEEGGGTQTYGTISFLSGSMTYGGYSIQCSGQYCLVVPTGTDEIAPLTSALMTVDNPSLAEVRYTGDNFPISLASFMAGNDWPQWFSHLPVDGENPGEIVIPGVGTATGCNDDATIFQFHSYDKSTLEQLDTNQRANIWCDMFVVSDPNAGGGGGGEEETGDTEAPVVTLNTPTSPASGTITLTATATDNVGVEGVTFKYDGITIGSEDIASPYTLQWDTTNVGNGTYALTASARDATGNIGTSDIVVISVDNTPPGGSGSRKALLLSSGFEGTAATYLNGFTNDQHCCSYSIGQSTAIHREGSASLRTEVRNNDPMVSGGQRAEVVPIGYVDTGDRWYGWSAYFESPALSGYWNPAYGGNYMTWNRDDNVGSGPLGMQGEDSGYLNAVTVDSEGTIYDHYGPPNQSVPHTRITANTWHDFVVHANWSTGLLEVWVDGALLYSGSNAIENPSQYLKIGIARWTNAGSKWVVYYDSVRVGDGAVPGLGYYDVAPGNY